MDSGRTDTPTLDPPGGPASQHSEDKFAAFGIWIAKLVFFNRTTLCIWRLLGVRRVPLTRWIFVTRREDVMEVLGNNLAFKVRFADVYGQIDQDNFLLGMNQGTKEEATKYSALNRTIMQAFSYEDAKQTVARRTAEHTYQILSKCNADNFDAVGGLITRCSVDLVTSYFGIDILDDEKEQFAEQAIALNKAMFGDLTKPANIKGTALLWLMQRSGQASKLSETEQQGVQAGRELLRTLRNGVIANRRRFVPDAPRDTVLDHLFRAQDRQQRAGEPTFSDHDIANYFLGMVVGFVPTNTMAGAHMLEMLLKYPDFLAAAQSAQRAGDDDRLRRCLLEAMRFCPLRLLPQRTCTVDDYVLAKGTRGAMKVYRDQLVLCSLESAMFDERYVKNPKRFDPERPASDYLLFGYGIHTCIGVLIAETQLTGMFKALLQVGFQRRGEMELEGLFPRHLHLKLLTPPTTTGEGYPRGSMA